VTRLGSRVRAGAPAAPQTDDPHWNLTPGERFERAIERRDAMIRDRRASSQGGRRRTDRESES
jgi:hypothetical protein